MFSTVWAEKKEEMLSFMSKLAAEGYRVISIDAYGHGERRANNQATSITAMQVVMRLTIDWDTVLAYYKTLSNVSLKNFAMVGFSMGGLATYNQLAFGQYKPTVIAPLIATPDFKSIVEVSGGNNEDYPDAYCVRTSLPYSETTLTPEQLSELLLLNNNQKSLSPYNTLVNNVDWQNTALLALYSSNDTIVPHSGTVNLQNSIPFGGTPHIFGNMRCGHYVSEQDKSGAVNFIQAHLPVNRNLVDITLKLGSNVCVIFDTIYTANNTAPVLSAEGEMFLPIRSISTSALGYSVEYDAETGNVELTDGNHIVTVISNSDLIYINGRSFLTTANYSRYLNVQCQIVNSDGGSYVVLYKDSYQYALLNQAKASIYVAQYQNLTEA